jgi:amino acid transporter
MMILQFYLKGLLISTFLVLILTALYLFTYLVRNTEKPWIERRNRIFDLILISILTIPILSFAVLGILVILNIRGL